MKYAALALALAPSIVAAAGTLGLALGTKQPDGSCKNQQDYEADFDAILANTGSRLVRTYAASDCDMVRYILPAAKAKNFKVVLGVWPDVDVSYNRDRNAIAQYAPQYKDQVWGVSIGSESLYRKAYTGQQLANKISEVKQQLQGQFRVGTADSWNKFADGTADDVIKSGPDFLFVNAFGFWQGQDIKNATATYFDDLLQAYRHIEGIAGTGKIDLWGGETGWPTVDTVNFGAAKGGLANAQTFWNTGICGALAWGYNLFYFEAFDEPWKPHAVGDGGLTADETHWGAMNADRSQKFKLKC